MFFLGEDINISTPLEDRIIGQSYEKEDITHKHELARLVMADVEDIMYSAVCRAIGDCFGEK